MAEVRYIQNRGGCDGKAGGDQEIQSKNGQGAKRAAAKPKVAVKAIKRKPPKQSVELAAFTHDVSKVLSPKFARKSGRLRRPCRTLSSDLRQTGRRLRSA